MLLLPGKFGFYRIGHQLAERRPQSWRCAGDESTAFQRTTMRYILALDQGTTSSRAMLVGQDGRVHAVAQRPFEQIFPKPGWVEHDPVEIWSSQFGVAMDALAQVDATAQSIAAVGITNQRETTIIWDRKTGEPVHNAI